MSLPETATPMTILFRLVELLSEEAPDEDFDRLATTVEAADSEHREALLLALTRGARLREMLAHHKRREQETQALFETARDLTSLRDVDEVLAAIVQRVRQLLHPDATYMALVDERTGDAYMRITSGTVTSAIESVRLAPGRGVGGLIIQTGRPFATSDYMADTRLSHDPEVDSAVAADGLVSMAGAPMKLGEELVGALFVANRHVRTFTPSDMALLSSLADHASILISNARLYQNLQAAADDLQAANEALRRRGLTLERASAAHQALMPLALRRADLAELASDLKGILPGAVVIVGVDGTVLAKFDTDDGDPLLRSAQTDWGRLVAQAAVSNSSGSPPRGALATQVSDDGGSPVWVVPVQAGSETFAHLLFRGRGELHEADVRTLELSAQTAALLLLMERQVAIVEQQLRGELIDDLLAERPPDWAAFHRRARRAGMVDLDRPHSVLVMSVDGVSRRQLLRAATEYAAPRHGLAAEHATNVVLLLPDVSASEAAGTVPAVLGRALQARVTAGAAGPASSAAAVRAVHADADRCHRLLVALGRTGVGSTIEDLGALGLILEGTTRARVRRLLADALGPLLAYDAEHNALLVDTLHSFFMAGRNPPAAARLLQVHPNTVYQRLERIEMVLGHRRWREPQGELEMQLALQFHRILKDIPLEDLLRA